MLCIVYLAHQYNTVPQHGCLWPSAEFNTTSSTSSPKALSTNRHQPQSCGHCMLGCLHELVIGDRTWPISTYLWARFAWGLLQLCQGVPRSLCVCLAKISAAKLGTLKHGPATAAHPWLFQKSTKAKRNSD